VAKDGAVDPKALHLGDVTVVDLVARIAQTYELDI